MIEKPIIDYIEGWYNKDPSQMKQGLHPKLAKRHPDPTQGLANTNLDSLLSVVPVYGGAPVGKRRIDITILDSKENIAAALVKSNDYVDYLHLVKVDQKWQIINVLWQYHGAGGDPAPGVEKLPDMERMELEKPLRNYVEGWYNKDAGQMGSGLHSSLVKRSINTDNPLEIDEYTKDSLLEVVPLYGGAEGDKRLLEIKLLDIHKDIAFAKVTSNAFTDYIHLCGINNQWMIVNVLWSFR